MNYMKYPLYNGEEGEDPYAHISIFEACWATNHGIHAKFLRYSEEQGKYLDVRVPFCNAGANHHMHFEHSEILQKHGFVATLRAKAAHWFTYEFPRYELSTYAELQEAFLTRFRAEKTVCMVVCKLASFKQGGMPIRDFSAQMKCLRLRLPVEDRPSDQLMGEWFLRGLDSSNRNEVDGRAYFGMYKKEKNVAPVYDMLRYCKQGSFSAAEFAAKMRCLRLKMSKEDQPSSRLMTEWFLKGLRRKSRLYVSAASADDFDVVVARAMRFEYFCTEENGDNIFRLDEDISTDVKEERVANKLSAMRSSKLFRNPNFIAGVYCALCSKQRHVEEEGDSDVHVIMFETRCKQNHDMHVKYPVFSGKKGEDPDVHIAIFNACYAVNYHLHVKEPWIHQMYVLQVTLKGKAMQWAAYKESQTYDELQKDFLRRFQTDSAIKIIDKLASDKQKSLPVSDFVSHLKCLRFKLRKERPFDDVMMAEWFLKGLRYHLKSALAGMPPNFDELVVAALRVEYFMNKDDTAEQFRRKQRQM